MNGFTLSDSVLVDASVHDTFHMLIDPKEQMKWNTLYEHAEVKPEGEIKTGSIMTGTFKGSGKATVHFEDVVPDQRFTHYSTLRMFGFIRLGQFRHTYQVQAEGGKTRFTQTVVLSPRGFGRLLAGVLVDNFRKRLPESFAEFIRYAERPR